jgi:hypothetical protein
MPRAAMKQPRCKLPGFRSLSRAGGLRQLNPAWKPSGNQDRAGCPLSAAGARSPTREFRAKRGDC